MLGYINMVGLAEAVNNKRETRLPERFSRPPSTPQWPSEGSAAARFSLWGSFENLVPKFTALTSHRASGQVLPQKEG